ncbi:MAG: DUF1592 domain-containing protein [Acidobacteriia bacterium]|nr:DUF1592 domain-containing protein [Terriglobia bacterium]
MKRIWLGVSSVVLAGSGWGQQQKAFVDRYCAGCHNDKLKSGGFSWNRVDLANPGRSADQLEKVIRKLDSGMMPPAGMPRPDAASNRAFVRSLEDAVDQDAARHLNPGRPPLHRLNRTEYANSVRDLLGVDIDVASLLPPDDMSHGFDNMADALTVSPTLMESYIRAAGKISREALGDPSASPAMVTYKVPRVLSQIKHIDGTPFGTRGGTVVTHDFPADGDYVFRTTFYFSGPGVFFGQLEKGERIEIAIDGERVALLDINPHMQATQDLRTPPIHVTAGPKRVSAAFLQRFDGPVDDTVMPVEQSLVDVSNANVPGLTSLPHLHDLSVIGPEKVQGISDTPSRRRILQCRPASAAEEIPCAKRIITSLVPAAYRKPVSDADVEEILGIYQQGRNQGGFESGMRLAVQAIIANPQFVFRFERTPANLAAGSTYRISDLELASRLSYFLWSSAPDAELLAVASQSRLHDADVLEMQVRRMLADPRSSSLATNFAYQWLHLQDLKDVYPDDYQYPNFDDSLRQAMWSETELLFENVMRQDRSVFELLTANYTFVNERLARHYGIPNILGSRFRRVELTDPNRFGLLGQGSILTLTSLANRTSPVRRGKWVMDVLLGTPPPPPPANVPALKENQTQGVKVSVRERLEEHRSNPACAACHKMMDPIGFALENFDPTGVWRTNDSGFKVDPSGVMFDGAKLSSPAMLRQAILVHPDAFLRTFTANLLAYGVGRVLEPYDMPAVRAIDRDAERSDNRFVALLMGVVRSAPFQMRKSPDAVSSTEAAAR